MADNNQSWEAWSNHVLMTLEKLEKKMDSFEKRINENNLGTQVEIVSLKAKAGVWGIIAGFVVSTIVSVLAGFLVYQLTVGGGHLKHEEKNDRVPTNGAYMVLPQRNDLFPYKIAFDDEGGKDTT